MNKETYENKCSHFPCSICEPLKRELVAMLKSHYSCECLIPGNKLNKLHKTCALITRAEATL